jgi:hypothetical protein
MKSIFLLILCINLSFNNGEKPPKCISKPYTEDLLNLKGKVKLLIHKPFVLGDIKFNSDDYRRFQFNENGEVIQHFIGGKKMIVKAFVKMDKNNCPCESSIRYSISDTLNFTNKSEYDYQNLIITENAFDYKNELTSIYKTQFDSLGNTLNRRRFNPKNELIETVFYEYNERKDITKMSTEYANEKKEINMITKYNYAENSTEKTVNFSDSISGIFFNKYNKNGDVIENRITGQEGVNTYKYRYDEKGNWIKMTILEDGKATHGAKRKLKYYRK